MELKRLLCVDDSEADQFLNQYRIRKANPDVEIREAYDGEEALTLLREPGYVPDLILLDINMPRMNGFEFLEAYAAEFPGDRASVVVMLTSSLLEQDRLRAEAYEVVRGFLYKPLKNSWAEDLQAALQDVE